jgi:hypothetical protein
MELNNVEYLSQVSEKKKGMEYFIMNGLFRINQDGKIVFRCKANSIFSVIKTSTSTDVPIIPKRGQLVYDSKGDENDEVVLAFRRRTRQDDGGIRIVGEEFKIPFACISEIQEFCENANKTLEKMAMKMLDCLHAFRTQGGLSTSMMNDLIYFPTTLNEAKTELIRMLMLYFNRRKISEKKIVRKVNEKFNLDIVYPPKGA